jgi:preprotein translocase subunit YajC
VQLLDLLIPVAHADDAVSMAPAGASPLMVQVARFLNGGGILLLMIPLFYFMLIRPQMRRSKEARDMLGKLAKGDEIVTNAGLAGRITAIGEVYLTVEIAEKVEVKIQKSAITSVLPKGTLKAL